MATALSEVGRLAARHGGRDVEVSFAASPGSRAQPAHPTCAVRRRGWTSRRSLPAGRLVDALEVDRRRAGTSRHAVTPPSRHRTCLTAERVDDVRRTLAASAVASPLDELAAQNQQLLAALDEARRQRDRLEALNDELEETNRGVMALYHQLSDELEETNRGVVALYAELDEKSAQLRAASEAKTRFLANVSHELRAPVTAIIGLLPAAVRPGLRPAHRRAGRAGRADPRLGRRPALAGQRPARPGQGRVGPARAEVGDGRPRPAVRQLRGTLGRPDHTAEVELVVDDPGDGAWSSPTRCCSPRSCATCCTTRSSSPSAVRCGCGPAARPTLDRFTVADTGIGIPADQHERDLRGVLPGARPPARVKGTGLGLPYARRLVGILGGALRLVSEPGEGSTFTVDLPVRGSRDTPPPTRPSWSSTTAPPSATC